MDRQIKELSGEITDAEYIKSMDTTIRRLVIVVFAILITFSLLFIATWVPTVITYFTASYDYGTVTQYQDGETQEQYIGESEDIE